MTEIPENLPLLSTGQQDFENIRRTKRIYVDKTAYILRILQHSNRFFFLSRPRRFGKSLLINTLKEIFLGKRELFEGLYIADKIDWKTHPVLLFDFSKMDFKGKGLEKAIRDRLSEIALFYEINLQETTIWSAFRELIEKLHQKTGEQVVILIDEYDKPITDVLETFDNAKAHQHRDIMRAFYGILKGSSAHIHLLFLTGITRFTKVSIFSELNNLTDLTFSDHFHSICGYTQEELEHYFSIHWNFIAKKQQIPLSELMNQVKTWYNGYSWNGQDRIYNPFSILRFLDEGKFMNYWFDSGTPKFLIRQLKEKMQYDLKNTVANLGTIDNFDIDHLNLETLMFQTGYLTFSERNELGNFILNYPNKEVEQSMQQHLMGYFSENLQNSVVCTNLALAIRKNDLEMFVETLNILFADIPAEIFLRKKEAYYHSIVFLALKLSGYHVGAEVRKATGRLDAVLTYQHRVYIFEFKLDESTEKALQQIHEKAYYRSYQDQGKEIYLVGINFSSQTKEVESWKVEKLS